MFFIINKYIYIYIYVVCVGMFIILLCVVIRFYMFYICSVVVHESEFDMLGTTRIKPEFVGRDGSKFFLPEKQCSEQCTVVLLLEE